MITKTDLEVYKERLNNILVAIADPPTVTINVEPSASITIIDTIPNGKLIKIGKGYYSGDIYYKAEEAITSGGDRIPDEKIISLVHGIGTFSN